MGQRVIGENPESFDVDPDFTDPVQEFTRRIVATVLKEDGTAVDVEMLQPVSFVDALGLVRGSELPLHLAELDVKGIATVTEVTDCPTIQQGEGQVVTARFITRHAENRVRVTLSNGTEFIATDVHPVWTPENRQWTPAGEQTEGTLVDTLEEEVTVQSVKPLSDAAAVYNIEVNGHHVYRVADVRVFLHNTCSPVPESCFNLDDSVNTEKFRGQPGSSLNTYGEVCHKQAFSEELLGRNPEMFSTRYRYRIEEMGLSPEVDPK
ncbi:hypothetical protein Pla100_51880 [Neorhodopirellula pilleata]|uniref:Intein C-terminal splicing domain-containing protein n=1 Tax=Neorhodopirellula pilleata TaxID=2714738 RepID=A0A5C5ZW11_9BACT|nr:hypothetical protein Pla100_51880 [Neorhodopirellula pilleata]